MQKKRILFVSEFTKLSTGYAVYTSEVMKQLHKTDKYELAELASYCPVDHPEIPKVPWKVYPNLPDANNQQQVQTYESNPIAEFGEWKFEAVCIDFKPDIVCSIRDFWMDSFIDMSPFRRFYKTVMMPTVDASPQHPDWIDLYISTDAVLAYNDWSLKVLEDEGGGLINLKGSAPPSANQDHFKFISDKKAHKQKFGIRDDTFIIGMVARNQRRKLYPDLADGFVKLLGRLNSEQRKNVFLYWHTAYPDLGWDIPLYIKNNGLGSKILFTYICQNCRSFTPSFYKDVRSVCRNCNHANLVMPSTQVGIEREQLGEIVNLFDIYVQYATNEGFGIPLVEAAFCGVPIVANDYSAMTDVLDKLGGIKIKNNLFHECETGRKMAIPDSDDFAEKIARFISLPESIRNRSRMSILNAAQQHYSSWEKVAKKWEDAIDSLLNNNDSWQSPPMIIPPLNSIPNQQECPDEKFIAHLLKHNTGGIRLINKFIGLKLYRDLVWGRTNDAKYGGVYNEMSHQGYRPKYAPMDRDKMANLVNQIREKNNFWEQKRWNELNR